MGLKTIQLRRNKFYDPFTQIDRNNNSIRRHRKYIFVLGKLYFNIFASIFVKVYSTIWFLYARYWNFFNTRLVYILFYHYANNLIQKLHYTIKYIVLNGIRYKNLVTLAEVCPIFINLYEEFPVLPFSSPLQILYSNFIR